MESKSEKLDSKTELLLQLAIKEIELTMDNTYAVRMRFIFAAWVGPFILLGALLVARDGKLPVTFDDPWTWLAAALGTVGYFVLGWIAGKYEKGNWNRCDELRRLVLDLTEASAENTHALEDPRNANDVIKTYFAMFGCVYGVFLGCVILVVGLV